MKTIKEKIKIMQDKIDIILIECLVKFSTRLIYTVLGTHYLLNQFFYL